MTALVHADAAIVVVDKPSGLLAVPGKGEAGRDNAWDRVRREYADALVVHRLDMATSGLLLFARDAESQRRLGDAFAARAVEKRYVAVVAGRPPADAGRIDLAIGRDWNERPRRRIDAEHGKPATTLWRVLALEGEGAALRARLELEPQSGRTHQLRVHLAAIGHPIVGDALYAPPDIAAAAPRLLLHASALRLAHPRGGAELALACAVPF